jgi:cytochrome c biogenesis protein CcmG, thiol:disulfide interchange protein DsbE
MTASKMTTSLAKRMVWLPLILFIGLIVLFLFSLFAGDPARLPSTLIGRAAPAFSLPALPGSSVPALTLEQIKGQGLVLVNIWASWCLPCRDEHPVLLELSQRKGVKVVGINYKDDPEQALKFLNQLGNPYAAIGADRTGRIGIEWGVYGVPETFVVNNEGVVVHKIVGPLNKQQLKGFIPLD